MTARLRFIPLGLMIAALLALPYYAAPDGHEHAVLAQFFGRFHPLMVHLPIALILLVPLLEFAGLAARFAFLRPSAGVILGLATFTALLATGLGWLLAWSGGYHGATVTHHFWGGVLLSCACLLCCWIRLGFGPHRTYFLALVATVGLMAWTSHQGAALTHGSTYLTKYMPAPLRRWLALPPATTAAAGKTFYAVRVQPILDDNCVTCHNPDKNKGDLRLDSYELLMKGGKHGAVVKAGDAKGSEMYKRVTLPTEDKHFMPSDGKRPLSREEIKVLELWIASGASDTLEVGAIKGVPALKAHVVVALAPDYHNRQALIADLEKALGLRLLPRSQVATDGLVLRTASAPERATDTALAKLRPVADLIVDAELARTPVTNAGLKNLAAWTNLRALDLSHTAVSGPGLAPLSRLKKLESVNLTETSADPASIAKLEHQPGVKHVYSFNLKAAPAK